MSLVLFLRFPIFKNKNSQWIRIAVGIQSAEIVNLRDVLKIGNGCKEKSGNNKIAFGKNRFRRPCFLMLISSLRYSRRLPLPLARVVLMRLGLKGFEVCLEVDPAGVVGVVVGF